MPRIIAELKFHPIGQGLFTTGDVYSLATSSHFRWVFDCGSTSKKILKPAVKKYTGMLGLEPIDMLVISHFDTDHVEGLPDLLRGRAVKCIVLPYMPLWFRMLLAVRHGASGSYFRFLVDPAAYLSTLATEVERFIYIVGSEDGTGEVPFQELPDQQFPPAGSPIAAEDAPESGTSLQQRTSLVPHTASFAFHTLWEFIFYNETPPSKVSIPTLQAQVARCLARHKTISGRYKITPLRRALESIYNGHFGHGAKPRNDISLAMYSGPTSSRFSQSPNPVPCHLATGDGCYDSFAKITALRNHLGNRRWASFWLFQVPHHGSKYSWFLGAALNFTHSFSIITAGSKSKKHPDPSVIADLAGHNPFIVSEIKQWWYFGWQ